MTSKALFVFSALALVWCSNAAAERFEPMGSRNVDEVRVYAQGACEPEGLCRTIADADAIAALVAFVDDRREAAMSSGTRAPPIRIEFYRDGFMRGYLGVDRESFELVDYFVRGASAAEIEEISRLAGLDPRWFGAE
ncbi:MAG: hypothetical protein WDM79_04980 [Terricaulis sp.]